MRRSLALPLAALSLALSSACDDAGPELDALDLTTGEPQVTCRAATCSVYATTDLTTLTAFAAAPSGRVMGVLGRKDNVALVSRPMADHRNAVQAVKLDSGEWTATNLPLSDDRVECVRPACTVYATADLVTMTTLDIVPLGRQMGILGLKDDLFFVSPPMPDRGNAVQAVKLSEGWIVRSKLASFPAIGLTPAELAQGRAVFEALPSSFDAMTRLRQIRFDAGAPNARYHDDEIAIDATTRRDRTLGYVLMHELAHAWSKTYGTRTYALSPDASRGVGSSYAEAGGAFERCYPCSSTTTAIGDCYAAASARRALEIGATIDPTRWAEQQAAFDEDFAETVAAYFGGLTGITWVDDSLRACTPTHRFDWLARNLP